MKIIVRSLNQESHQWLTSGLGKEQKKKRCKESDFLFKIAQWCFGDKQIIGMEITPDICMAMNVTTDLTQVVILCPTKDEIHYVRRDKSLI